MRVLLIAFAACSGAVPAPTREVVAAAPVKPRVARRVTSEGHPPVDIIAVLSQPQLETSWVTTGPGQLVLGGTSLQPLDDARVLDVDLLEERGSEIRVGVRHGGVRFAIWTARTNLHAALASEQRIVPATPTVATTSNAPVEVVLKRGSHVTPLASDRERTRLRYVGAVEIEGSVPSDALIQRGTPRRAVRRRASGKPLLVTPGTNIRAEPRWGASVLALVTYSTTLGIDKARDDGWYEVTYDDDDVRVHGFVSRNDPPGAVQPRRTSGFVAKLTGPDRVAGGTCLYAAGEVVGLVVGSATGALVPSLRPGWYTFTLETPWDTIDFDVQGPTENDLVSCGSPTP